MYLYSLQIKGDSQKKIFPRNINYIFTVISELSLANEPNEGSSHSVYQVSWPHFLPYVVLPKNPSNVGPFSEFCNNLLILLHVGCERQLIQLSSFGCLEGESTKNSQSTNRALHRDGQCPLCPRVYNLFYKISNKRLGRRMQTYPVHPADSSSDGPFHFKNPSATSRLSRYLHVARHLNQIPAWLLEVFVSKLFVSEMRTGFSGWP
jgi:hypothetical protein